MNVLITAAGTQEPVDDVRVLSNLSTGRLGAALANSLQAEEGVSVTLLSGPALTAQPSWVHQGVERVPFTSAADLQAKLQRLIAERRPRLVFMAAAVADYSPVPTQGKRPSDSERWTIELRKNPKLLDLLRGWCGPEAVICGFKLMSSVSPEDLVATARRQMERADLDLCVANDLAELSAEAHPAWIVARGGEAARVEGDKASTAARIGAAGLAAARGG